MTDVKTPNFVGIAFLAGFIIGGVFFGIGILGQGGWSLAMHLGEQNVRWDMMRNRNLIDLAACPQVLRAENLHPSQAEACASVIERVLETVK